MTFPEFSSFAETEPLMHQAASGATGLSDFGDPHYLTGLRVFLRALDSDLTPTPFGKAFAFGGIVGALIARLRAVQGWKDRPDCLERPIRKPLVITGVPRTGTTALHKLMSMDPQFQGLDRWLTMAPQPRPPRDTWAGNPDYQACVANLKAFFDAAPEMRAAHDMVADEVDECLEVLKSTFVSNFWGSSYPVPSYDRWWMAQDETPAYRHYARALQLIGADDPDRRWLVKNPGHIWHPEGVLDVFPDACIIQTHRDPAKSMPSLCKILVQARGIVVGADAVDAKAIARREVDYWSRSVEKMARVRERLPASQVFDVDHRAFRRDPMGTITTLYGHFGLDLSQAAEHAMLGWIENAAEEDKGSHQYTLEEFGLRQEEIHARFDAYMQRHGLK